ncbi:MAG: hypothetical protein ABWZ78_05365 [Burkholderiaceae bacterium]
MVHLFAEFKDLLEAVIGLDRNVLHVHLGIILFLVFAWCLPDPHRYSKAFIWLIVVELCNEFFDVVTTYDLGRVPNWPDTLADIINTLIWPAAWCLFRRRIARALRNAPDLSGPV